MKPFRDHAATLVANGYQPIPTHGKDAFLPGWPTYTFSEPDAETYAGCNVGLKTGTVVGLDFDLLDAGVLAAVLGALPPELRALLDAAPRRIGRAPKCLYLLRATVPGRKKSVVMVPPEGGDPQRVEALGIGQQFVAAGIHPDTKQAYQWNGAGDPLTLRLDELPEIMPSQIDTILHVVYDTLTMLDWTVKANSASGNESALQKLEHPLPRLNVEGAPEPVVEALRVLDPDDRDSWIAAGQHLKSEENATGETWPEQLWLAWSQLSGKWREADAGKWGGFTAERGKLSTLLNVAGIAPFEAVELPEPAPGTIASPAGATQALTSYPLPLFLQRYAEPPTWVIDRVLPKGALYALTAVWGHFKTALALLMADCIATGTAFNGQQVAQGSVLYLAGENPHDVALRLTAMFNGRPLPENLTVFPFPFAVDNDAEREAFVKSFNGRTFDAVIIDTGPAYTQRDEENDNAQAHKLAMAFRALIEPLGRPCVLALMHPVKNASKDNLQPRGGGAFSGSIDGELAAWADTLPSGVKVVEFFHRSKFRGPGFAPMTFAAQTVALPQFIDNFGRAALTVTLKPEVINVPVQREPRGANAIAAWRVISGTGERDQQTLYTLIAAKMPVPKEGKEDRRTERAREALAALQNQRFIELQDGRVQALVGLGKLTAVEP